jgi:hypothetical protein
MTTTTGSVLDAWDQGAHAVIPVNCVGAPGKGLALAWAKKDPAASDLYKEMCWAGSFQPGVVKPLMQSRWLLAATKKHWRDLSRQEWVVACLWEVFAYAHHNPAWEIAMPALGCGCGKLNEQGWFIGEAERVLGLTPNVTLYLYRPPV